MIAMFISNKENSGKYQHFPLFSLLLMNMVIIRYNYLIYFVEDMCLHSLEVIIHGIKKGKTISSSLKAIIECNTTKNIKLL